MNKTIKEEDERGREGSVIIIDGNFKVSGFGYRHQQSLIMLICLTTAYSMRACIGVALVDMVEYMPATEANGEFNETSKLFNTTDFFNDTNINISQVNVVNKIKNNKISQGYILDNQIRYNVSVEKKAESNSGILAALLLKPPYPKLDWSPKIRNIVISSFFWGYMLLQIPSGQLLHRFGARYLLVGSLAVNCFVSFCFPWAVYYGGWIFGTICRIVQGLTQACIIPGLYGFFGQWAPLHERSRMMGFATGGQALGTVLGLPVTGFIAASPLGWPGIFRFYGILSGIVAALVFFMVTDTPAQHPKISLAERRYIEEGLGLKEGQKRKKMPVPWRKILGSRAIYFIALAHISLTWGQITLFAIIPNFMDKVMKVNIKSNGLLTALPFLVMWFTNFFFSWFTDWVIVNKYLSLTNARKMANTIACVPATIGLVVLAYAPKTIAVVESILIFICAFKISAHVGSMVTHVDIAPNFAGTMMSISNFCSNLFGSQAPMAVGFLVTNEKSEEQWRNVFFLAAGLYFFTNLAYCIFGTAEKAAWNDPANNEEGSENIPELEAMISDKSQRNGTTEKLNRTKN